MLKMVFAILSQLIIFKKIDCNLQCEVIEHGVAEFFCVNCLKPSCTMCLMAGHADHTVIKVQDMNKYFSQELKAKLNAVKERLPLLQETNIQKHL